MQARLSKNDKIVVVQSGGPSSVINRTAVSLVFKLKELGAGKIYGAHFGIEGILKNDFYDLGAQSERTLRRVSDTPGSALGTARHDPTKEDCEQVFRIFSKMGATYLFYIGGDDSARGTLKISNFFQKMDYPIKAYHLAKTIDNDLKLHYHTPGYGSAALHVANTLLGVRYDLDSDPKLYIAVTMGKDAGYIAAASSLMSCVCDRGPDKIYVPETRFSMDSFLGDAENLLSSSSKSGMLVVSEGIWSEMQYSEKKGGMVHKTILESIGANKNGGDGFGGVTLSGTGALGDYLAGMVQNKLRTKKVRADTFGYPQRSSYASKFDSKEAATVGAEALMHAQSGEQAGSVALKPLDEREDGMATRLVPLSEVGNGKREMPREFLSPGGNYVNTENFAEYALPLVGGKRALRPMASLEQKFFHVDLQDEKIRA